jgi:8-oxo-dGTP pyrophosphatase MutT (NUDIX family)
MKSPTLKEIDEIRSSGFRPGVVGCFIHEGKLLLLFKRDYKLWLLPQGGIDNKETPEETLKKETLESLGEDFVKGWKRKKPTFIFEDKIELNKAKQGEKDLNTDSGEVVHMLGKHYYYYVVEVKSEDIELAKTEFDDYVWAEFIPAKFLAERVYQKNKAKALLAVLEVLKKEGLIV